MGKLDEPAFDRLVQGGCPACGGHTLEIRSFIDRRVDVMLGDPNNDGRWAHDGEKFVDGTYGMACVACGHAVFTDAMCPRCNAEGGLAKALADTSRMTVPKRCGKCSENELMAIALIPAKVRYSGAAAAKPDPLAEYGDAGYHIVAYACESCDAAVVAQSCPLCDAPGPLRPRP